MRLPAVDSEAGHNPVIYDKEVRIYDKINSDRCGRNLRGGEYS